LLVCPAAERVTSLGKDWHRPCLKCEKCKKTLSAGSHAEHDGKPYCHKPCYGALFGPGGKQTSVTMFKLVAKGIMPYKHDNKGSVTFVQEHPAWKCFFVPGCVEAVNVTIKARAVT
ncbi:Cysteine-rich protein 1, partial [Nibea albiflora]